MSLEDIWRTKNEEELQAAVKQLAQYTEAGQRVILAEMQRRRAELEQRA